MSLSLFRRSSHPKHSSFKFEEKFILNERSDFQMKEAYKALRTNILFSLSKEGCKCILVTSSQPSDGKSINCVNTAIAFAQTGAKVLVMDCDLRRPNIARILKGEADVGISNVLVSLSELKDVIHNTQLDGLDVIYSGDIPPNPAELLSSPRMGQIIETLSDQYDYIFIDSPPINAVTDATVLTQYVDGVIVIVRQNYTDKRNASEAVKQLGFAEAKILGFVFNAVGHSVKGYGGYYKYRKYGYYDAYRGYYK